MQPEENINSNNNTVVRFGQMTEQFMCDFTGTLFQNGGFKVYTSKKAAYGEV
jgi:hypothetical protein